MIDAIGNRTILDLFRERTEADPHKIWLRHEDRAGVIREYSYGEFLDRYCALRPDSGLPGSPTGTACSCISATPRSSYCRGSG